MFVYFIIILSRSQQFPTSSSQNQVELGEWATGHFMHCIGIIANISHYRFYFIARNFLICHKFYITIANFILLQ